MRGGISNVPSILRVLRTFDPHEFCDMADKLRASVQTRFQCPGITETDQELEILKFPCHVDYMPHPHDACLCDNTSVSRGSGRRAMFREWARLPIRPSFKGDALDGPGLSVPISTSGAGCPLPGTLAGAVLRGPTRLELL